VFWQLWKGVDFAHSDALVESSQLAISCLEFGGADRSRLRLLENSVDVTDGCVFQWFHNRIRNSNSIPST
jgi:hypothetical protein